MKISDINKLRRELLEKYKDDPLKKAYIERYASYLKIDAKCDTDIRKNGAMVWIENGSQRFVKTNPAVEVKLQIAKKLERLEHQIGLSDNSKEKRSSLI